MTGPVFVDTNVLVYVRDATEPAKQRRAASWMTQLWDSGAGRLSYQVLQEYYVLLTAKLDPPRRTEDAREDVRSLLAWRPLPTDHTTIERAWDLRDRFALSWWDALIVSAALASGARHLLTEDLQDGQEFDGLSVVNPFERDPEELFPDG